MKQDLESVLHSLEESLPVIETLYDEYDLPSDGRTITIENDNTIRWDGANTYRRIYIFDDKYTLSVIWGYGAMRGEHPYEWRLGAPNGCTEPSGGHPVEAINSLIRYLKYSSDEEIADFVDANSYDYNDIPEPPEDDYFDCCYPEPPEEQYSYRWEDDNDTYDKSPDLEYDPLLPSAVVVTSTTSQHSFENDAIIYFCWKFVIIDCSTGVAIEDSSYRGQYKGEYDSHSNSTYYYGHRCPSRKKLQYIVRQAGYNLLNTITI